MCRRTDDNDDDGTAHIFSSLALLPIQVAGVLLLIARPGGRCGLVRLASRKQLCLEATARAVSAAISGPPFRGSLFGCPFSQWTHHHSVLCPFLPSSHRGVGCQRVFRWGLAPLHRPQHNAREHPPTHACTHHRRRHARSACASMWLHQGRYHARPCQWCSWRARPHLLLPAPRLGQCVLLQLCVHRPHGREVPTPGVRARSRGACHGACIALRHLPVSHVL